MKIDSYYIVNIGLILVYPLSRMFKLFNFYIVDSADPLGTTRENSIFYCIIAFTIVKWYRRYSIASFFSSIFFTIKLALITSYIFVDIRIAFCYMIACLSIWLFFRTPKYQGESKFKEIQSLEEYEDLVGVKFKETEDGDVIEEVTKRFSNKKNNNKQNKKQSNNNTFSNSYKEIDMMTFVEFFVDWADTCEYTKEIWCEYSMKYSTDKFQFIQINLAKIPKLAKYYQINTSGVSRQLPTVLILEDGEEVVRFPPIDAKTRQIAKVLKYDRKEIAKYFDMDKRYLATR